MNHEMKSDAAHKSSHNAFSCKRSQTLPLCTSTLSWQSAWLMVSASTAIEPSTKHTEPPHCGTAKENQQRNKQSQRHQAQLQQCSESLPHITAQFIPYDIPH